VANHKSALKRIRQNRKRAARNRHIRTGMRTVVKAFRTAVDSGDEAVARERLIAAEKSLRGAASKGVIPKARADRNVSRLAKRFNAMSAASSAASS
jgi:small subunit ribosomal protein S20